MSLLFTVPEWAAVARDRSRVRAHLAPRGERYEARRLTYASRLIVVHDPDGDAIGTRRERVSEPTRDGERRAVRLTVVAVEPVDVFADGVPALPELRCLTTSDARACSERTVGALRDAWRGRYPRSDFAQIVWFAIGDWRDRDRYLNWTGRGGGDYTQNPRRSLDPDAPALSPEEYDLLGVAAAQRDARRRALSSRRVAAMSDSERMGWIEQATAEASASMSRELRTIDDRLSRIERRSAAQRADAARSD